MALLQPSHCRWMLLVLLGVLLLCSAKVPAAAAAAAAADTDSAPSQEDDAASSVIKESKAQGMVTPPSSNAAASTTSTGRSSTGVANDSTTGSGAARQPSPGPWWRGQITVMLMPRGELNVTEGESRELHCRIFNRPLTAQVRWFYAKRSPHRAGYSNYTILANEYLTINPERLQSTYVEPATYMLTVKHFNIADSGEYTCFLQASPYEVHRDTIQINVHAKTLPETTVVATPTTTTPFDRSRPAEHSTTMLAASTSKHVGPLGPRVRPASVTQPSTQLPLRTIPLPTTLKQKATQPLQPPTRQKPSSGPEPATSSPQSAQVDPMAAAEAGQPTRAPSTGGSSSRDAESSRPSLLRNSESPASASSSRCDYHIIVHEVDENSCPTVVGAGQRYYYGGSGHRAAASAGTAGRYQADDVHGDYMEEARSQPSHPQRAGTGAGSGAGMPALLLNERVDKLEDRLIAEMVKQQMANHTMVAYESALREAERLVAQQGHNLTQLDEALRRAEATIERQRVALRSVDEKLAGLMLDMAETNARLDKATRRAAAGRAPASAEEKQVPVTSATDATNSEVIHFKDCDEVYRSGHTRSDVYYIKPLHSSRLIPVWCDMDTWPGGWLVLQRRREGTLPFNHNWNGYRHGFGNVSGEFWLGNDNIFLLTNQAEYMLRVDMWDFFDSRVFAEYRTFKVDGERDQYKLSIGNHSGTAKDGLQKHDGVKFSTPDRDNDLWSDYHCALDWNAGWWFTNCWHALLNGGHSSEPRPKFKGICWIDWKDEQLKATEMKIRPTFHLAPTTSPTALPALA